MVKSRILFISVFIILTNCIYSQQDNNVILWRWADEVDERFTIGFSTILPENWVAIKNVNPSKGMCYHYESSFYKNSSILTAIHLLNDSTDEAFEELITFVLGNYNFKEIEQSYSINEKIITYDVVHESISYSRYVFIHYKEYCLRICLSTRNYERFDELLVVLNELINSIIFYE
jgi:hypothetical protein